MSPLENEGSDATPGISADKSTSSTTNRPRNGRAALQPLGIERAGRKGTWAGGVLSSRKTVVSEFVKLISDHENVFEVLVDGVGSDIRLVGQIVGEVCGWGTLRNVITAHRSLSKHYNAGDRIILTGYSRGTTPGAWAARYLAKIVETVGLPKDGDEKFFHDLYKACDNGSVFKQNAGGLTTGYECWPDVEISALCCFDTVGSLGLPLTGLTKPLATFRMGKKQKPDMVSDVASNVQFSFHCLSIHETRAPYAATLMRGSRVRQVYFPGNHSHLGWIDEAEGLVHAPFAWMVQQLHTHLHIRFNDTKLADRFPSYRRASPAGSPATPGPDQGPRWCQGVIPLEGRGILAVMGKKARRPGHLSCSLAATDVRMHIGARLRAQLDDVKAVPGYVLVAPATGDPYWARRLLNTSVGMAERIEEAEVGPLEARLLGLSQEIVGNFGCGAACCVVTPHTDGR